MRNKPLLIFIILLQSACITTHSVPDMGHSQVIASNKENGSNVFKFQSKLKKEKTRNWIRNYLGLPKNNDLVNTEVKLFPDVDYIFIITVNLAHDREETLYLHEFFDKDRKLETEEGPVKFFVSIQVIDQFGVDHLSSSSIFQEKVHQYLLNLEKEFNDFSRKYPEQNYFNG
ncbi:hypothetical protein [Zunongwangia sp. H14]|uniref:hypothetical protein n=1 Tax=Zunongwangia sp. H14 TaxID=3240792 RepID=UPI003565C11F